MIQAPGGYHSGDVKQVDGQTGLGWQVGVLVEKWHLVARKSLSFLGGQLQQTRGREVSRFSSAVLEVTLPSQPLTQVLGRSRSGMHLARAAGALSPQFSEGTKPF